jgi:Tannase-like family of unknown function (DUF6351)
LAADARRGGSGGSYQQHHIADGYPGLLDGIMPARSFPDLAFATVPFITDARLLKHYFDTLATVPFTDEQKRQITGFGNLVDACWTRDDQPQKTVDTATYGSGRCEELYPSNSVPRGVAGWPVASDIVKCQLKPIASSDYKVSFTAEEMTRLKRIFPGGVCDWSKPGVEQQPPAGTWIKFGNATSRRSLPSGGQPGWRSVRRVRIHCR